MKNRFKKRAPRSNRVASSNVPYWFEKLFRTYPVDSLIVPCCFVKPPGIRVFLAGLAVLTSGQGFAKSPPKPAPPAPQRELWVPTQHLQSVLKKMPRAVMLTPEQHDALLRDSQLAVPNADSEKKPVPPVQVTIRDAKFSGTIAMGGDVVTMTADYVVESFTSDWAEIPLSLPQARMASIEVDTVSVLRVMPPKKKGAKAQPILVVKGKGKHAVKATFHIPVKRSPSGNSIVIASPATAAASLDLGFPDGAELDSALPFVVADDQPNLAKFVLPTDGKDEFEIRWIARNVATIPDAAIFQNCQYLYSIDSTRVQADLGFVLNSNLTKLPNRFEIKMAEDVRVLSVEGAELLRWTRLDDGVIEVVLVAGERDVTDLRVLAEADVAISDDANDAVIELPIADVSGIHRASGTMALIGSDDVRVKNIATGSLTAPIPDDVEGVIANDPNYVASFRFPVAVGGTEVTLSKVGEKFKAQMDTLIAMERESVELTRTLNIIPDEGRTFEIDFDLPDGEELLDVKAGNRSDFSWIRGEGNSIRFSWKAGLSIGAGDSLTITSRRDPEGWFALGEEAMELNFTSATIDGAEALSGYVAVSFNESFRVETATANGLDPRDGRTTPISGTLAWFRLSDFDLTLNASRRATEIEASHIAYALPLASNLEIEGQVDVAIRYTPIGRLEIVFPVDVADQVRFDSPLISEKTLNEETGAWTLDFHDELIGPQRFRYRMSLPFEVEEVGKDSDQKRFEIGLPVVKIPAAKRLRGDWVLEANTDTELTFEAKGLDAVDSLRVPAVSGYQPRHRVIAAYRYRGDSWSLKLAGTRHAHEDLVSTVIDSLRLDTVVSTDGDERHQALMSLRTTGEQFLEIGLPKDSVLWTLKVDHETVKPIRAAPGTIRVQLPAHENANARAISVKLIYQTPGRKWTGSGKEKLQPIRVADRIPIMRTKWFLHLPEGYDYQKFESNLGEEFEVVDRTLLGYAGDEFGRWSRSRPMSSLRVASVFEREESVSQSNVASIDALIATAASSEPQSNIGREPRHFFDSGKDQARSTFMGQVEDEREAGVSREKSKAGNIPDESGKVIASNDVDALRRDFNNTAKQLEQQIAEAAELDKRVRDTSLAESDGGANLRALQEKVTSIEQLKKRNADLSDRLQKWSSIGGKEGGGVGTDREIERKLKTTILPSIEFVDTPVSDALEYLQQRSIELDVMDSDSPQNGISLDFGASDLQVGSGAAPASGGGFGASSGAGDAKISLSLKNIPLAEALRYSLSQAGMEYKIENGRVRVIPQGGYSEPELVTRRYRVPSNFLARAETLDQSGADAEPSTPARFDSAKEVLEYQGITFPVGSDVVFDTNTGELKVRNTADQIELTEVVLDMMTGSNLSGQVNGQFSGAMRVTDTESNPIEVNENKLKQIILPSVEFVETPLRDALEYLQQRAVELDANETDPARKGLNLVIDSGLGSGNVGDTKITLRLKDVPLVEALRYTTSLAQMKYRVEPNAVLVVPLSRPDDKLYTNVYTVPPTFLTAGRGVGSGGGAAADPFADPVNVGNGAAPAPTRMSAQEVLEMAGVTFPPGGSASYNPQTGQMVVRTTQDQMELVEIYQDTLSASSSPVDALYGSANGGFAAERLPESEPIDNYNPREFSNQVGNQVTQFFGQKAMDQLNPNWREVPVLDQMPTIGRLFQQDEVVITENRIELENMKINDLDLQGKTVEEALGLIREKTLAEGATTTSAGSHSGTSRSKLVKFIYQEPAKIPPSGVDPAIKNKLDLKLSNVTVLEALEKISEASDTHFRVTPDGIAFAPKKVTLEPMQTIFIELPESEFQMSDGNGGLRAAHARYVLKDAGIKFPTGSSAAYNPATGRLAVRNTRPNLEAIASHYAAFLNMEVRGAQAASRAEVFEREFLGGAADLKGFDLADIGRLPIDFTLPESGRSYSFTGLVAPESIEFRFVNWERQIRFAWIWILVGGLAFWFGAFRRLQKPVFIGLLGVVLLSFVPLVISQSLLAFCNALLIGWLVAAGIWMVWRIAQVGGTGEVSA